MLQLLTAIVWKLLVVSRCANTLVSGRSSFHHMLLWGYVFNCQLPLNVGHVVRKNFSKHWSSNIYMCPRCPPCPRCPRCLRCPKSPRCPPVPGDPGVPVSSFCYIYMYMYIWYRYYMYIWYRYYMYMHVL